MALGVPDGMSPTVNELRNEIRVAVGRFEREFDAPFTKEELAAIADALGEGTGEEPLPSKAEMRTTIRRQVGLPAEGGSFVKAELSEIADALAGEDR